jgi:hypothetical protein
MTGGRASTWTRRCCLLVLALALVGPMVGVLAGPHPAATTRSAGASVHALGDSPDGVLSAGNHSKRRSSTAVRENWAGVLVTLGALAPAVVMVIGCRGRTPVRRRWTVTQTSRGPPGVLALA